MTIRNDITEDITAAVILGVALGLTLESCGQVDSDILYMGSPGEILMWMLQVATVPLIVMSVIMGVALGLTLESCGQVDSDILYMGSPGEILMWMLQVATVPLIVMSVIMGVALGLTLESCGQVDSDILYMGSPGEILMWMLQVATVPLIVMSVIMGITLVLLIKPGVSYGSKIEDEEDREASSTADALMDLVRPQVDLTLPRPSWERKLCFIVSFTMTSMFVLVIATAYVEAQSIWDPFQRRVSVESNPSMETWRPFNPRGTVLIHSDSELNDYGDSPQNFRGGYASSNGAARVRGRQGSQKKRSRIGFSRPSMQATSSQLTQGSTTSGQEGPPAACQLANQKARRTKQLDLQGQSLAGPSLPHRGLCPDDAEYANLIRAIDNDLDRPDSLSVLESKGKLRGNTKAQRKKEEREKKSTVKTQGEELKDNLADDSSSTTTETSNPDVEANIKEEPVKKKGRTVTTEKVKEEASNFLIKPKKQGKTKKESPAEKSSSLELPYVTPLENKRRQSFTSKALHPLANIPKTRPLQKQRFDGKLEEGRSLQTINADPFLKGSITAGTSSPPPTSPSLLSRGSNSSVLNSNSEGNQKKAPGNKLSVATLLAGKNGNPTYAAVVAGYDKSPGGSGPGKTDSQGKTLPHMTSVERDSSDSSGLWSPIDTVSSTNFHSANSFSLFQPNNSFNLTRVLSGMNLPKSSESQQSWPDFTPASSIWDIPSSDWPRSSSSPATPTASLLGNARGPWSATTPFGSSIWSTNADSALRPFPPTTNSTTLTDLVSSPAPSPPASTEMSRPYNPWSMWRLTLSRSINVGTDILF
ncbi:transmembrane protein 131-like isoform X2 [Sander lucioperca]|uniref:transmembrane protein 131-like isoform X2 n=1 Tax=Sander lucioperca TaxID=283035 RepID=UPI00125E2EFE|nr:transmembrane protein 131-like isoform X2 [Sander lucioperca]